MTPHSPFVETMCLSFVYWFRNIASYLSKVANFPALPVCWAQDGSDPVGISRGAVYVMTCLAVFIKLRLVTDRQTDGRTDTKGRSTYRASTASRGKSLFKIANLSWQHASTYSTTANWCQASCRLHGMLTVNVMILQTVVVTRHAAQNCY